jgi:hypothetical protein
MMSSPFPPWTLDEVRGLVAGAGFRDASVRIDIDPVRYPSAREFLRREAASSPLSGPMGELREDVRNDLIHDLEASLQCRSDDEGVVFPIETYVATAHR